MEIEPALDLRQHLFVRLIQPDPDEAALARLVLVELVDIEIGDPAAIFIGRASYHLAHAPLPRRSPYIASFERDCRLKQAAYTGGAVQVQRATPWALLRDGLR